MAFSALNALRRCAPLQRRVERSIRLDRPARGRHLPGSVWGVCLAKNEADIIEATVRHNLEQGLDAVIVADNGSNDGTLEIVRGLAETLPVFSAVDTLPAHHQGRKTSYLAHLARRGGADWVVPFDADEHWYAPAMSVAQWLRCCPCEAASAKMWNAFPTVDAQPGIQLSRFPMWSTKIAFRSTAWAWVGEGNHRVSVSDHPCPGLHIIHYQYRSFEQYDRKVVDGSTSLRAAAMPPGIGGHWRAAAALSRNERKALWLAYLTGAAQDDQVSSDRQLVDVSDWAVWDPQGLFLPHDEEAAGRT